MSVKMESFKNVIDYVYNMVTDVSRLKNSENLDHDVNSLTDLYEQFYNKGFAIFEDLVRDNDIKTKDDSSGFDRFDLEQHYIGCWGLIDDLRMFNEQKLLNDMLIDALVTTYSSKFIILLRIVKALNK